MQAGRGDGARACRPLRGLVALNKSVPFSLWENASEQYLTDRPPPSKPNEDREIPYLLCKECNTPCYVFEVEAGYVSEALCLACGNEVVGMFTVGEWEDENA